jgi:hypothetical protein
LGPVLLCESGRERIGLPLPAPWINALPFLFASIPWIALVVYLATRVRLPPPLASLEALGSDAPLVSVIVPARNEERSIRKCVESICASATWRLHGPPWYGVIYPLGALVGAYIFTRSWAQGSRIEWKSWQYGA